MKTLSKFECRNCTIKIEIQSVKEVVNDWNKKLYKVTTTPKRKNTWKEYSEEFDFSSEANKYMMKEIEYWLIL